MNFVALVLTSETIKAPKILLELNLMIKLDNMKSLNHNVTIN